MPNVTVNLILPSFILSALLFDSRDIFYQVEIDIYSTPRIMIVGCNSIDRAILK